MDNNQMPNEDSEVFDELAELDLSEIFLDEDWRVGVEEYDDEVIIATDEESSFSCPECGAEEGELHSCGIID